MSDAPNILFVLTDDQGPWALGRETPELLTPTLDRLAAEGTYLERFFCASPVCSPARASLLTGRMPSAHGVHDWLRPEGVEPPGPQSAYIDSLPTFTQALADGGYHCGLAGKWHVGNSHEPAAGFEYWYTHRLGGSSYYDAPIWEFDEESGRTTVEPREAEEPRYFTDAVGDHGVDFLRRHAAEGEGRPFFLQLATTAPHAPWTNGNHPDELVDLYADTDFPSVPAPAPHPWSNGRVVADPVEHRHRNLAGYAAAVTGIDRMLARVLAEAEEQGLLENTIVLFTSDNGFSCGHHGIWGKGNGTFPLNFWENSIRVPFIAWGPGRIAAGRVSDHLVSATSVFETVLELAGVTAPPDPLRIGRSVAALLTTEEQTVEPPPSEILVLDEYGDNRMIRTTRWKYVTRREGPEELYDLETDPEEARDLSADPACAAVRDDLATRLRERFARCSEPGLDGWDLPVTGKGQNRPLGSEDRQGAFEQ
ncbi:phosphodiesterase [Brachybacterium avium]|uniref:Phosphodiesterase n=1 Tax=Brachybacterium avium TaxID=2017485 RepID=A0A220UEX6_9MICO|nr:sulfatase-like hydrolase/transferase [Brachybacterium avium]ASK66253.1 phosphodiesterase [Brachybacterium avium]